MNLVGEWGSLAFFVPFPKVGSIPVSVDTVPTSPRNALYGFCARALPPPSSSQPAEQAARGKAIGGESSQWASLLLACAVCGVGAALEAWKRSVSCRASTMSSIGTGVSLSAMPFPTRG